MEKHIEMQNKILSDLIALKTELVNIHISANNSIDESGLIRKLALLNKTTEEVKEMFILMHTNNVTITKHMNELLVTNMMSVIDVEIDTIRSTIDVTNHIHNKHENNLFNKTKSFLIRAKFKLLGGVVGTGLLFLIAEIVSPGSSKDIMAFILSGLKIIF